MANGLIGKVTAGGGTHLIASTAYFTCETAAAKTAKVAAAADTSLDSITLMTGLTIYVKFTHYNSVASPTLALYKSDGTTNLVAAKPLMRFGTTVPGTNAASSWRAGAVVAFTYDGTNWVEVSSLDDNTTYSAMSVAEMRTGTATSSKTMRADYLKTFLSTLGGTALTLTHNATDGLVLNHDDYVTAGTAGTSSATSGITLAVPYVTYNAQGHITEGGTHTHTIPDASTSAKGVIQIGTGSGNAAAGNHTHSSIVTIGDQRGAATTPNSYSNNIIFQGLKTNSSFGSPSTDNYSYVIGLRGWSDSSGGNSHELAFNNTGIFWRSGATTTWGNWYRIYTTGNKPSIADHSYTPAGSVNISTNTAVNTTTVNSITAVGTLPSLTVTATDVVTGGTTTAIPNISKKTVVTGVTKKTVVTSATFNSVVTSATVANEILTISTGAAGSAATGDSVTVTTGDSVTVGTAINAYTALTTSSIGSASDWSPGTLPTKGSNTTVATGIKTQPAFTFTGDPATLTHSVS